MPKFTIDMYVVRTITESKREEFEIEAASIEEAEDKAADIAQGTKYHDREEKDWDLEDVSSEAQDIEVTSTSTDDNDGEGSDAD